MQKNETKFKFSEVKIIRRKVNNESGVPFFAYNTHNVC